MKWPGCICLLGMMAFLGSCQEKHTIAENGSAVETAPDSLASSREAEDTVMRAAAPAVVSDSVIQEVTKLMLHALGNTPEEMHYDQDTLQVKPGAFIKLQLINDAHTMPMVHNVVFTVAGKYEAVALAAEKIGAPGNYIPKDSAVIAASPMALPGQTIELEFTAPTQPGAYEFVCTYPGHWQRMHGKLMVQ